MKKIAKILIIIVILNLIVIPSSYAISPSVKGFTVGFVPWLLMKQAFKRKGMNGFGALVLGTIVCGIAGIAVINSVDEDDREEAFGGFVAGAGVGYFTLVHVRW